MTRNERDDVMFYAGKLEGIATMLFDGDPNDEEDNSGFIKQILKDISSDLGAVAKGADSLKGGDEDDV